MPTVSPRPMALPVLDAISESGKRVGTKTFRSFFHSSSHAVVGRLACLSVVPALVIFNVTPPPE